MTKELSQRVGNVFSLIDPQDHKMVRKAVENSESFDDLPKDVQKIIQRAETLAKTNPLPGS